MRMAPGRGRGHLCWWPLIFISIHKPPASITLAPIKHALAVTVEPFKFSPAEPVAYELSYNKIRTSGCQGPPDGGWMFCFYYFDFSPVIFYWRLCRVGTWFEAVWIVREKPIQGRRMKAMDAHFYFALALILFVFFLCFRFRKENQKK
jgi:hypothetical protein